MATGNPENLRSGSASGTPKPFRAEVSPSGRMPSSDKEVPYGSYDFYEPAEEEPDSFFDVDTELLRSGHLRSVTRRESPPSKKTTRRRGNPKRSKRTSWGGVRKIVSIVVTIAGMAALATGGYFIWDTFFRYDDAADIQGEWRTEDSTMTVVIDETDIRMPDLEYAYEIDTRSKQITFSFSDLSGSGTYSFSEDRSQLTIVEGEGDSATSTVLIKVSDNTEAEPQLLGSDTSSDEDSGEESDAQGDSSTGDSESDDGSDEADISDGETSS